MFRCLPLLAVCLAGPSLVHAQCQFQAGSRPSISQPPTESWNQALKAFLPVTPKVIDARVQQIGPLAHERWDGEPNARESRRGLPGAGAQNQLAPLSNNP